MNISQVYIAIAIASFAVIALILYRKGWRKKQKRMTPLAGLSFGFVLAGIIFHDGGLISYSLLGIGVVLAVVDMINQTRYARDDNSPGPTR